MRKNEVEKLRNLSKTTWLLRDDDIALANNCDNPKIKMTQHIRTLSCLHHHSDICLTFSLPQSFRDRTPSSS